MCLAFLVLAISAHPCLNPILSLMDEFVCPVCLEIKIIAKTEESKRKYCSRTCASTVNGSMFPKRGLSPEERLNRQKSCKSCGNETNNAEFCSKKCVNFAIKKKALDSFLAGESKVLIKTPTVYAYLLDRQDGTCAVCDMPPVWNGKPLIFIHDHIDGNSENNHPDNIRLVCSNCDSQLDTYKAKNKGSGRHYRRTRYAAGQSS